MMARNSKEDLIIQDRKVDSENEWNVGLALQRLGYEFDYQHYLGGRGVRGSVIVDFLVYTNPLPVPLFVHGEYWHTGTKAMEDQLQMQYIESRMRGTWDTPVIIWGNQCETEEDALAIVREKLG